MARNKAKIAEFTSDLSTDDTEEKKRARRKIRFSSSESETENVNTRICSLPEPPKPPQKKNLLVSTSGNFCSLK